MSAIVYRGIQLHQYPVDRIFPITAVFMAQHPAYWPEGHKGVDFGAKRDSLGNIAEPIEGKPFYAVLPGKIQISGPDPKKLLGNRLWVVCQHPDFGEIRFGYAHAQKLLVPEGSTVERGTILGLVGKTGIRRDGTPVAPHLHFMSEICNKDRELLSPSWA